MCNVPQQFVCHHVKAEGLLGNQDNTAISGEKSALLATLVAVNFSEVIESSGTVLTMLVFASREESCGVAKVGHFVVNCEKSMH